VGRRKVVIRGNGPIQIRGSIQIGGGEGGPERTKPRKNQLYGVMKKGKGEIETHQHLRERQGLLRR